MNNALQHWFGDFLKKPTRQRWIDGTLCTLSAMKKPFAPKILRVVLVEIWLLAMRIFLARGDALLKVMGEKNRVVANIGLSVTRC